MKTKEKQGITLIALVITIIVLLILAGVSIAVLTGDNGTITKAVESKFKTELAEAREEFELYVTEKYAENSKFEEGTLNAGKGFLTYNTMPEGETGNIYDVLKNTPKKYAKCFEIIKGELIYANTNKQQLEWALELGMKINPYLIDEEGTLLSSNTNLMLMDENTGTVVLPESVKKIADGAFRDVPGIRRIIIPGTVKEIGNYAFSGNPTIEEVIIQDGVEKIGAFAFEECSKLKSIHIANTVVEIGSTCFSKCTQLIDINFPTSLKNIPVRMLSECTSLTEIEIPEGIVSIDSLAFAICTNVTIIKIPSTVTSIIGNAFNSMPKLTNLEISKDNKTYSYKNNFLMSRDEKTLHYIVPNETEIYIPETIETIGACGIGTYPKKANLHISKNVKKINTEIGSNIVNIDVNEENQYFKSIDGNLYNKDVTILYRYAKDDSSFVVPETVKTIEEYALWRKFNLSQLTLPKKLETIKAWAFSNLTKITQIDIPDMVNNIEPRAFVNSNITINISTNNNTYKTAENGAMILSKDGKKLITVSKDLLTYNIPNSVENIGVTAFYIRQINQITIPANVKRIETSAFDWSTLQKIEISANIEYIGTGAFTRCNNLKEIIIHKSKLPDGSDPIPGAPWGCPNTRDSVKWQP